MKKNGFLTFCFSFIPGAGQMYQEYMRRGVSIMAIFAIFIAIYGMTGINLFLIPLPIIYAYSFFDTYNLRSKVGTDSQLKDGFIWSEFSDYTINGKNFINKKNSFIGVILILIGIYLVFNSVVMDIGTRYDIRFLTILSQYVMRYLPSVIIASLSIWFGIKLMINKK